MEKESALSLESNEPFMGAIASNPFMAAERIPMLVAEINNELINNFHVVPERGLALGVLERAVRDLGDGIDWQVRREAIAWFRCKVEGDHPFSFKNICLNCELSREQVNVLYMRVERAEAIQEHKAPKPDSKDYVVMRRRVSSP